MAKAWPRIQHVSFAEDSYCQHVLPLRTTMGVLSYFVAYCPDLDSICFSYAERASELYSALGGKRSTSKLTRLMIDCNASPIARPADVALYLVFPQIKEMYYWQYIHGRDQPSARFFERRWAQVNDMIPVLARMREMVVDDIEKEEARQESSRSPSA
ncbi:hypothetical protein C8Q80DRAFT_1266393 [Daedaleopsis nitida]|nr:hypothetical protein C8Q80DRAFT_1266393 [Daedaleopsis nitida]